MRVPITVHTVSYDLKSAQPAIDSVRQAFVDYLKQVPPKSAQSKHGLMGPVGKILAEVKSGRRDPASLKGYAVRVHEAMGRGPTESAMEALSQGIDGLVGILDTAPITFHDRILDRLDYGLYYDLRLNQMASKKARTEVWIAFLRARYGDETRLSEAWGEKIESFERLFMLPRADTARTRNAAKQKDVADFWQSQGITTTTEEEDEE